MRALIFSVIAVSVLSILGYVFDMSFSFYALFPGMAVSLLITGGHGGTGVQDSVALVVAFAINLIVYSFLFFWLMRILRLGWIAARR
jgi:hypothetical protein